jgi:GGDEF domain-containing protein
VPPGPCETTYTDPGAIEGVAKPIADAVREVVESGGDDRPVTASVDIASNPPIDDVASLLHRADEDAHREKQRGGDEVAA